MQLALDRAEFLLSHPEFSPYLLRCARELQHGTERLDQLVDSGKFPGTSEGIVVLHGGQYQPWHIALLARAIGHMKPGSIYLCAKTGTSRFSGGQEVTESEAIIDAICAADGGVAIPRETFVIDPQATNTGMEVRMMRELPNFSCRVLCSKWHARRVSLTWQREAPHMDIRVLRVHSREDDRLVARDVDPILREAWKIVNYPARGLMSSAPRLEEEQYRAMFSFLSRVAPDVYAWLEQEIPTEQNTRRS